MPADIFFPEPGVAKVSKHKNREVLQVSYSIPTVNGRDFVVRAATSKDGGRTWQPDPQYRETKLLNSESASVVYRVRSDDLLSRSVDGGVHWTDCQFNVGGVSAQRFAWEAAHNDNAVLGFDLSAIHPRDPATVYGTLTVGVRSKTHPARYEKVIELPGVYVSHDAGDNWSLFAPNLRGDRPDEPTHLGIDPSNPQRMIGHAQRGMVMTTDGGKSWNPVGQQAELEAPAEIIGRREELAKRKDASSIPVYPGFSYLAVRQVEFEPGNGDVIYLVTNKGLYKSEDAARSWCLVYAGRPSLYELHSLVFDPERPNRLFISTRTKVLVSEDRGCHFRALFDWEQYAKAHPQVRARPRG